MERWIVVLSEVLTNRFVIPLIIFIQPAMFGSAGGRYYRGRNMFFGVRVVPAFIDSSAARAISRQYRLRVWIWSAVVALIYATGTTTSSVDADEGSTWWLAGILMANLAGAMLAFASASRRTRADASPLPEVPVRVANVFAPQEPSNLGLALIEWAGMLLPIGLPVATIVVITKASAAMPWRRLEALVAICLIGALPALTQFALRFRARSSDWAADPRISRKRRALLGALQSSVFLLMIVQFCALTLMQFHVAAPFADMNSYFRFSFPAQFVLLAFVEILRRFLSREFRRETGDRMPDDCWKWGYFYFNRNDPALVVPLRSGMGYSFNHARVTTMILMAMTGSAVILLFFQGWE